MNTISIPTVLLPKNADMRAWAVNACDQFTSDGEYWQKTEEQTGGKLSALHMILPEIYLKDGVEERIASANAYMEKCLKEGVFKKIEGGFILVERSTPSGVRTGIVLAIDLEDYSYIKGSRLPVRSTEETILERIPPRVKIRKNAPLELPHIMLLYNDAQNAVLKSVKRGKTLYDFPLMMDGGEVKGTFISNPQEVINTFYSLVDEENFLFAVGDGNHSLATAKTCWEELKPTLSAERQKTHPARFALVEAVNVFDPALQFKPIHRYVKTQNISGFLRGLPLSGGGKAQTVAGSCVTEIPFPENIPVGIRELDEYIADFLKRDGGEVDYIHGETEIHKLAAKEGVGIILPAISKKSFFPLIAAGGNLPKKTFSMGEGNEKRYYIEAKLIKDIKY